MKLARFACVVIGHDTTIVFGDAEGQIRCRRCDRVLDRWPALRPEHQHRDRAPAAAFWAKADERQSRVRPFRKAR